MKRVKQQNDDDVCDLTFHTKCGGKTREKKKKKKKKKKHKQTTQTTYLLLGKSVTVSG
jgi:hypothetical protein